MSPRYFETLAEGPEQNNNFLDSNSPFGYKRGFRLAQVAQSVEQRTENPRVGSSILSLGTRRIKGLAFLADPFSFSWYTFGTLRYRRGTNGDHSGAQRQR